MERIRNAGAAVIEGVHTRATSVGQWVQGIGWKGWSVATAALGTCQRAKAGTEGGWNVVSPNLAKTLFERHERELRRIADDISAKIKIANFGIELDAELLEIFQSVKKEDQEDVQADPKRFKALVLSKLQKETSMDVKKAIINLNLFEEKSVKLVDNGVVPPLSEKEFKDKYEEDYRKISALLTMELLHDITLDALDGAKPAYIKKIVSENFALAQKDFWQRVTSEQGREFKVSILQYMKTKVLEGINYDLAQLNQVINAAIVQPAVEIPKEKLDSSFIVAKAPVAAAMPVISDEAKSQEARKKVLETMKVAVEELQIVEETKSCKLLPNFLREHKRALAVGLIAVAGTSMYQTTIAEYLPQCALELISAISAYTGDYTVAMLSTVLFMFSWLLSNCIQLRCCNRKAAEVDAIQEGKQKAA